MNINDKSVLEMLNNLIVIKFAFILYGHSILKAVQVVSVSLTI